MTITFYGSGAERLNVYTAGEEVASWALDWHWTNWDGWSKCDNWRTTNYLLDNSDPLTIGGPTTGAASLPRCARRHPDLPPRTAGGGGERPLRTGRLPAGDGSALTGAHERGSGPDLPEGSGPLNFEGSRGRVLEPPEVDESRDVVVVRHRLGMHLAPGRHGPSPPLRRPLDTAVMAGLWLLILFRRWRFRNLNQTWLSS